MFMLNRFLFSKSFILFFYLTILNANNNNRIKLELNKKFSSLKNNFYYYFFVCRSRKSVNPATHCKYTYFKT